VYLHTIGSTPKLCIMALIFIFFPPSLKAQSAYYGGQGDGYAMAEVHNIVLGIDPSVNNSQYINLFPNPATNTQNLEVVFSQHYSLKIDIINILGETVFFQKFEPDKIIIPMASYKPGTYLVRLSDGSSIYYRKLVIAQP